jgi:hypothetical protein
LLNRNRLSGIAVDHERGLNAWPGCCDQCAASPNLEGEIMHGHLETAGASATSAPLVGVPTDETTTHRTSTAATQPMSEGLELAFDMVGIAIGAFIDSLS